MTWNWDHLRYFIALADAGTLSRAADELAVSHTTVLRRIRAFELQTGARLFEQSNIGYKLTSAGTLLYREACKMKYAIDSVSRDISIAEDMIAGPVVITSTDSMGFEMLPDVLTSLQQRYPALQLTLNIVNSLSDMSSRAADIAIRTCREPPPSLIGRCVGELRFVMCASTEYCKQQQIDTELQDLDAHHYIMLNDSYQNTPFYQYLLNLLPSQRSVTTVSAFIYAFALCRAGHGIALLPHFLANSDSNLRILDTSQPVPSNPLWVLCHADLRDTERIKAVRTHLYEQLSRLLQT